VRQRAQAGRYRRNGDRHAQQRASHAQVEALATGAIGGLLVGMSDQAKQVPDRGPLPQPRDPLEARDYLRASAFAAPLVNSVTLTTEEFTSVCPITGQPDFGTVTIEYRPSQLCIESRALKYYLWAYREEGAFCESVAARIADDIVYAIAPLRVEVRVTQKLRGGIGIVATAVRPA